PESSGERQARPDLGRLAGVGEAPGITLRSPGCLPSMLRSPPTTAATKESRRHAPGRLASAPSAPAPGRARAPAADVLFPNVLPACAHVPLPLPPSPTRVLRRV